MEEFFLELSLLIVTAAILSYLAILLKQPVIIAYILSGVLIGPWGLGLIKDTAFLDSISRIGITFLLFLAGLTLHPRHLYSLFKRTSLVVIGSCLSSFIIAFLFCLATKFSLVDSIYIALALMFSSTILVVKLLPTTKLHHGKIGAICIGILILEDLIAIVVLILMQGIGGGQSTLFNLVILVLKAIIFVSLLLSFEQFVIRRVMLQVDRFHETIFILGIAWCLGIAVIAHKIGLSYEVGAFFAGVAIARHPISLFISESLKPLRDFFLVLFFFVLGAELNLFILKDIVLWAVMLAVIFVVVKPLLLYYFFKKVKEEDKIAREASIRLGQLSEFSLLIAISALSLGRITKDASHFIQLVTILTMLISSYVVVFRLQTPIGVSEKLSRD